MNAESYDRFKWPQLRRAFPSALGSILLLTAGIACLTAFAERKFNRWERVTGRIVSTEVAKGVNPRVSPAEFLNVRYEFKLRERPYLGLFESPLCMGKGCAAEELVPLFKRDQPIEILYRYTYIDDPQGRTIARVESRAADDEADRELDHLIFATGILLVFLSGSLALFAVQASQPQALPSLPTDH
jgi:hypothetical protein